MYLFALVIVVLCRTSQVSSEQSIAKPQSRNDFVSKMCDPIEQLRINGMIEDIHEYLFGNVENEALISGKSFSVPDGGLTASSSLDAAHGTRCSRLGVPKPSGCFSYAWRATSGDSSPWIQVNLGRTFDIYSVATQGRGNLDEWTNTYHIASLHGSQFLYYKDRHHGGTKVFGANYDRTTIIRNAFVPSIRARVVRLYPITWHLVGSIRWELYGKLAFPN